MTIPPQLSKPLILASQSPRRRELLTQIGLSFDIKPSNFPEISSGMPPAELALHNAQGKARDIAKLCPGHLVLGVDTVVSIHDHILGKPLTPDHARAMLQLLSGSTHEVISALCLIDSDTMREETATVSTHISMDHLTPAQIDAYIATGEGEDKAGSYAVQGLAALFINRIDGDYFNVVGLPLNALKNLFDKF